VPEIGIRKEDKNRWERRVPLIPGDVSSMIKQQGIAFRVESSPIRVFHDEDYIGAGAEIGEVVEDCPLVLAVKEIPTELLREGRTYVFFSHTIKGQPYNMEMLRRLMELKCNLIDYERIVDESNRRLIFFGRYAGLAGMIDTLHCLGARLHGEGLSPNPFGSLKMTYRYADLEAAKAAMVEVVAEAIKSDGLPPAVCPLVVGFAGYGNVSVGAQEILDLLPIDHLEPEEVEPFLEKGGYDRRKIYKVVFKEKHMVRPRDVDAPFLLQEYYDHPDRYTGNFEQYLPHLTVLMNGIYWDTPYPRLFTIEALERMYAGDRVPRIRLVGDISCDVNGAVEFTKKVTAPDQPAFVYEAKTGRVIDGVMGKGPAVMAVDNLPCELPKESSEAFSKALAPYVPALAAADFSLPYERVELPDPMKKALIVHQGALTPDYKFMEKFLA
jgi:alpha-aminoadipic semialdehyde synthase